jgi:predicted nucleic acid-binding protein
VESLDRVDAEKAAELFNATGRRSKSYADCCIAAVAIGSRVPLATGNRDDFAPMVPHGLILV